MQEVKDENRRLNQHLDHILSEIEQKVRLEGTVEDSPPQAPIIYNQRMEYEKLIDSLSNANAELEKARHCKEEKQRLEDRLKMMEKEAKDKEAQITALLTRNNNNEQVIVATSEEDQVRSCLSSSSESHRT